MITLIVRTNHKDTVLIRDHQASEVPLDILNMADGDVVFEEEGHNVRIATLFCKSTSYTFLFIHFLMFIFFILFFLSRFFGSKPCMNFYISLN